MTPQPSQPACLGLRARTGRAIAIVLTGSGSSPCAVARCEVVLGSPDRPAPLQPYHEVMHLPWKEAVVAARAAERTLEAEAAFRLGALLLDLRGKGLEITALAITGAPERHLGARGSPHIRAHAAEGVIFRHVWQVAAEALGLPSEAFPEKGLETIAAGRLGLSLEALRSRLGLFGNTLGHPWRADEKAAALAAWMALAGVRDGAQALHPVLERNPRPVDSSH